MSARTNAPGFKPNKSIFLSLVDKAALAKFGAIRAHCALKMEIIKDLAVITTLPHTLKTSLGAQPKSYVTSSGKKIDATNIDVLNRAMSMSKPRRAMIAIARVATAITAAVSKTLVKLAICMSATPCNAFRPSVRDAVRGRRSFLNRWQVNARKNSHVAIGAGVDGRLGTRVRELSLTTASPSPPPHTTLTYQE